MSSTEPSVPVAKVASAETAITSVSSSKTWLPVA